MISLRQAVNNKCKECIYAPFGSSGAWREQVEAGTFYNCPLYPVRPLAKRETEKQRAYRLAREVRKKASGGAA